MQIFKEVPHIDFIRFRLPAAILSLFIIFVGIAFFFLRGINLGIDFQGGVNAQVQFSEEVNISQMRNLLIPKLGSEISVTYFGNKANNEFLVSISSEGEKNSKSYVGSLIKDALVSQFPTVDVRRIELVGPKVGAELRQKALLAILWSLIGILIYITIRFEFIYALGAILAIFHDVLIIVSIFILLGKEFNLIIIASLLTIVGYSLNDTIVIYDRIREKQKEVERDTKELINLGVNECLSRTILTSITTLLVVLTLYIFGGEILNDFALSIIIGLITGTYSSIFIAGSTIFYFRKKKILDPK